MPGLCNFVHVMSHCPNIFCADISIMRILEMTRMKILSWKFPFLFVSLNIHRDGNDDNQNNEEYDNEDFFLKIVAIIVYKTQINRMIRFFV